LHSSGGCQGGCESEGECSRRRGGAGRGGAGRGGAGRGGAGRGGSRRDHRKSMEGDCSQLIGVQGTFWVAGVHLLALREVERQAAERGEDAQPIAGLGLGAGPRIGIHDEVTHSVEDRIKSHYDPTHSLLARFNRWLGCCGGCRRSTHAQNSFLTQLQTATCVCVFVSIVAVKLADSASLRSWGRFPIAAVSKLINRKSQANSPAQVGRVV
jgi:hypothetical protein